MPTNISNAAGSSSMGSLNTYNLAILGDSVFMCGLNIGEKYTDSYFLRIANRNSDFYIHTSESLTDPCVHFYTTPPGSTPGTLYVNVENSTAPPKFVVEMPKDATSSTAAGLVLYGGMGVAESIIIGDNMSTPSIYLNNNTTDSITQYTYTTLQGTWSYNDGVTIRTSGTQNMALLVCGKLARITSVSPLTLAFTSVATCAATFSASVPTSLCAAIKITKDNAAAYSGIVTTHHTNTLSTSGEIKIYRSSCDVTTSGLCVDGVFNMCWIIR